MACQLPDEYAVSTSSEGRCWRRWSLWSLILLLLAPETAALAQRLPRLRERARLVVHERAGAPARALERVLRQTGAKRLRGLDRIGATVVEVPEDQLVHVQRALVRSGLFKSVEPDYVARVAEVPNDPLYGSQWGLPRVGAPAAWSLTTGSPDVTVAVLDTGVELDHADLAGRLRPDGYDFRNADDDPSDDNGHGTRMTGVIAATGNNAIGVSGVAPDTSILPVKVLDADGYGPYSAVADGIIYAVDHGAQVINLSLVGASPSSVLQSAIDYATASGVIVVAAAGNSGISDPVYPAASNGVVAVSAIDRSDARPAFSNFGGWIDFAAPGVDVLTTTIGNDYGSSTGTSPAAAFGSGVFALLLAANPSMSRDTAIQRVLSGAVDLGSKGWDAYFGWGRADAFAALVPGQIGSIPPDYTRPTVSVISPVKGSLVSGMVPIEVAANDNLAIQRVELFVDNRLWATETSPPFSFVIDASPFSAGKHKLRAYAYDTSGNYARSRQVGVRFTPGVGLLVDRAVARSTSASIKALFALPDGVTFDPSRDAVAVTLSTADGIVFSASAAASELDVNSSGRARATVSPVVPAGGKVRMIVGTSKVVHTIKVSASNLAPLGSVDTVAALTVQIGDAVLSQSITFRSKGGSRLIYP